MSVFKQVSPIGCFSRLVKGMATNRSSAHHEALSVMDCVSHSRSLLIGMSIVIYTYQQTLVFILSRDAPGNLQR